MSKAKDKVIYLDRRRLPTFLVFVPSEAALEKECKRLKMPPIEWPLFGGRGGHVRVIENSESGASGILIFIGRSKDKREVLSSIIHEAVHVWQFTCDHIGEENAGYEIEAYSIQAIAMDIIEAYEQSYHGGKKWL